MYFFFFYEGRFSLIFYVTAEIWLTNLTLFLVTLSLERVKSFVHAYLIIILKNGNFSRGLDFLLALYTSDTSEMKYGGYSFCCHRALVACGVGFLEFILSVGS